MILLVASVICSTASAFNSLYVFGDGICTTNTGPGGSQYYGKRECNGRTWVEVLAQRQGIPIGTNWSYYGQSSGYMVANVKNFKAPADATNDLFVAWAADADFVGFMGNVYPSLTVSDWNNAINTALTNHYTIITNLYAKGVRTLIMPNAVDVTEIPSYNQMSNSVKTLVRGRTIYFNTNLIATANRAMAACRGLTVYVPNVFSLLDNVLTNAAYYGLTNVIYLGQPIDALEFLPSVNINGAANNFIFWNPSAITARMSEVLADTVQQLISPVQVAGLSQVNGSNRLDLVNVPVGLNGFLDGCTNLALGGWSTVTNFNSLAPTQSIYVVAPQLPFYPGGYGGNGSIYPGVPSTNVVTVTPVYYNSQFYRLRFPYAWNWP